MYAEIIIDITHERLDRAFQYSIPSELEGMLRVGMEVIVPFGKNDREQKGYIIGFSKDADYDPDKIKAIRKIAPQSVAIESRLVVLAAWMKEHYGGTMIQALKTVLPIKRKRREQERRTLYLLTDEAQGRRKLDEYREKKQWARFRLMAALLDEGKLEYSQAIKKLRITPSVIRSLEEQKVLAVERSRIYRNPRISDEEGQEIRLTGEQEDAIHTFWESYCRGRRDTFLLYGVTGSGKTEVYIEMIARVVKEGRQAIVLIPEIALTYQTAMRFYRRFGDRVSIINSRLSDGERYDQMQRAREGEIDVVIGPRSALFTPFPKLGLIVIDEEHENTYKSEQVPRYHARETAIERARLEGACVVLGSATPSLEAYYRCQTGEYVLLELKNRTGGRGLPKVYTADMRRELEKGNRTVFSDLLRDKMGERLEKGQQIMLFLNRRGYAGFLSCRACGYVVKCPHCDVSLAAHKNGRLICHYCGYETRKLDMCPVCGSRYIGGFKAGTQQIEEAVKREFPQGRVLRMDMDTTRDKEGHERILETFKSRGADILVGTQMIVKGHDFPGVTLVGILAADMSLYANDYRAGERTFQLLTQAAGRAGRGEEKGEVVIQTYHPGHYIIEAAKTQDYQKFYQEEIQYRELMNYPPAACLLAVLMAGDEEAYLQTAAEYLKNYILRADKGRRVTVIGPTAPYVGKVNDIYRKILYLKCPEYDMLIKMKNSLEQYIEMNRGFNRLKIQFDFNPVNIF